MKIETKWNLGNFTVALEADASTEVAEKLKSLGLLYLGQRVSKVDKVLGGFEKKGDKSVRVVGWKRTDAEYSNALRDKLTEVFGSVELPDETKLECLATVTRYDGATKAEPKFAREKKKFAEKESTAAGLEAWLKTVIGYDGPTHGADGEYATEALSAAKVKIDAIIEAAMKAANA